MAKQQFQIRGMHCVGCAMTIDGALEDIPGVTKAVTHYARQMTEVEYDEKRLKAHDLILAIELAGYEAVPFSPTRR
jgi:copper chaperone CopZ